MGVCAKLIHSKHSLHTVPVALPHTMGRREDMEDSVPVLSVSCSWPCSQYSSNFSFAMKTAHRSGFWLLTCVFYSACSLWVISAEPMDSADTTPPSNSPAEVPEVCSPLLQVPMALMSDYCWLCLWSTSTILPFLPIATCTAPV